MPVVAGIAATATAPPSRDRGGLPVELGLQRAQVADRADRLDATVCDDRDPRRVIPPVLQPSQPSEQQLANLTPACPLTVADVADDPAHRSKISAAWHPTWAIGQLFGSVGGWEEGRKDVFGRLSQASSLASKLSQASSRSTSSTALADLLAPRPRWAPRPSPARAARSRSGAPARARAQPVPRPRLGQRR